MSNDSNGLPPLDGQIHIEEAIEKITVIKSDKGIIVTNIDYDALGGSWKAIETKEGTSYTFS